MKPYYEDLNIAIYNGDCRYMSDLSDNSVQCVVTSPPYWGLRKYSGEQELIWGKQDCEHQWQDEQVTADASATVRWQHEEGGYGGNRFQKTDNPREAVKAEQNFVKVSRGFCSLCGAWKGAYGLEPTPEMYVQHTIEILREIRRVLRKDGVVFWNIGDSYNSGEVGRQDKYKYGGKSRIEDCRSGVRGHPFLKPKDLCLIPFRIAIAAQEDGWWVRSVIIWSKPNPMPESVTDRPTESHEYILMLTKSARYYWDADAVREASLTGDGKSMGIVTSGRFGGDAQVTTPVSGQGERELFNHPLGRNIRTVWEFPTQPGPSGAVRNFAVFPEKLPELCIKAATSEVGCCSKCGAPWERITKPTAEYEELLGRDWNIQEKDKAEGKIAGHHRKHNAPSVTAQYETLGWQPTCKCNADKVPSIVLDPFAGAGTTLWVAKKLNRRAVGYEISAEYCDLAIKRNLQQVLL